MADDEVKKTDYIMINLSITRFCENPKQVLSVDDVILGPFFVESANDLLHDHYAAPSQSNGLLRNMVADHVLDYLDMSEFTHFHSFHSVSFCRNKIVVRFLVDVLVADDRPSKLINQSTVEG